MTGQRVNATPLCQRLAAELSVDLATVTGTGERGRIRLQDVKAAAARRQAERDEKAREQAVTRPHLRVLPELRAIGLDGRPVIQAWLAAENASVMCDSAVRQLAGERGVRLRQVTGTGPDGWPTRSDVEAVADRQDRRQAVAHAEAFPEPTPKPAPQVSFTASGLPVSVLSDVPPSVRRALAAAPTHAAAYALVQKYGGKGDDEAATMLRSDRSVSCLHGGAGLAGVSVPGWD